MSKYSKDEIFFINLLNFNWLTSFIVDIIAKININIATISHTIQTGTSKSLIITIIAIKIIDAIIIEVDVLNIFLFNLYSQAI